MKIVIDIPIEQYNLIMQSHRDGVASFIDKEAMIYAIKNGTQLPKGHGRLIDADALNRKDVNCANVPMNFIDTAPTIIEADKGE